MAEQPMSREEIETLIRRHNCSSCKPDTPPRMVRWECKTKRALRQLLREVDEAKTALADYSSHQGTCLRSYWQAGEQREDGYYTKWAGNWYGPGEFPECSCGLTQLLSGARAQSEDDDTRDYCGICDVEGHSADEPHGEESEDA